MHRVSKAPLVWTALVALLSIGTLFAVGALDSPARAEEAAAGDDEDKKPAPKFTLKQVMVEAHKEGLLKKILTGKSEPKEKAALLDYYVSMYEAKPKKGKIEDWRARSADAVVAAAKVVLEHKGAEAELKEATNCAGCHKIFK